MIEWIGPLVREPSRHLLRLARDRRYRAFCSLDARLRGAPRFQERRVRVDGLDLTVPDAPSFLASFREIFVERTLDFPWSGAGPRILDLGANIGLSVIAFKRSHPGARITALEPDPNLFQILKQNVHGNGFADVTLVGAAAWSEATRLPFAPDGADGGRALDRSVESTETLRVLDVEAISLPEMLRRETYDYIKMDIEGAERAVLPACAGLFHGISHLFVEYHGFRGEADGLAPVVAVLEDAGFRLQVHTVRSPQHPFLKNGPASGCDLILHLYASRR